MKFYPLLRTQKRFWIDAPPEVVSGRLFAATRDGEFTGQVGSRDFSLWLQRRARNSWRPRLSGTLNPANGGTLVTLDSDVSKLVRLFTLFHGVFFLGLTWLMGVAAFSWEFNLALKTFRERCAGLPQGATTQGVDAASPLSDPTQEDAENGAPWSFSPQAVMNAVRFTLYGTRNWRDTQEKVILQLENAKIVLNPGEDELHIPWHNAADAQLQGRTLVLGELSIDGGDHPLAHLEWLISHLHAQSTRFAATVAEREDFTENAQQLSAIVQAQIPGIP